MDHLLINSYFTPPNIHSASDAQAQLRVAFPYIPQKSLDYIFNVLYPPIFNGSYPYTDEFTRASFLISEAIFTCNTYYLSTDFLNETYSYLFAVPPAFHGFDVPFTYYTGGAISSIPTQVTNATVAIALQDFITSFAKEGVPMAEGVREFRMYGNESRVLDLNVTGIGEIRDSNANERCRWWQKALYS
jgi:carboxylesterase type B